MKEKWTIFWQIVGVVAIMAALVLAIVGIQTFSSGNNSDRFGDDYQVFRKDVEGQNVTCIVSDKYGSISCDWQHAE